MKRLSPKNHYTGPDYKWIGLPELCWARCTFVNAGQFLMYGMPLQACLMLMCQKHKLSDASKIENIHDVANFLVDLPMESLLHNGGFYIYLRSGEGVVVPPMYMIVQVNAGLLEDGPPLRGRATAEFVETWKH